MLTPRLDHGKIMTKPLLLHWVKLGAINLQSLGTYFFSQPSCLHSKLLKILQSNVISRGTKLEAKNTNHITEPEQKSLRNKEEEGEVIFTSASICFLSENIPSKRPRFFPAALEIVSPLTIKQSFNTQVVLEARRHRSVFLKSR